MSLQSREQHRSARLASGVCESTAEDLARFINVHYTFVNVDSLRWLRPEAPLNPSLLSLLSKFTASEESLGARNVNSWLPLNLIKPRLLFWSVHASPLLSFSFSSFFSLEKMAQDLTK